MLKLILLIICSFTLYAQASPSPSPVSAEEQASKEDATKAPESCGNDATSCGCKH